MVVTLNILTKNTDPKTLQTKGINNAHQPRCSKISLQPHSLSPLHSEFQQIVLTFSLQQMTVKIKVGLMLACPATLRAQKTDKNNEAIWPKSEREQLSILCLNINWIVNTGDSKRTAKDQQEVPSNTVSSCSLLHITPQSPISLYEAESFLYLPVKVPK